MDWDWIINLPHYRYGWTLFGLLAIIPALVSGNMLIHEIGQLWQGRKGARLQAVFMNAGILVISVLVIAGAIWQWF